MKKSSKIITSVAALAILGGAVASSLMVASSGKVAEVKADTPEISFTLGNTHNGSCFYAKPESGSEDSLYVVEGGGDESWSIRYYPTTASCIQIDGVDAANCLYPSTVAGNQSLVVFSREENFFDFGSLASQITTGTSVTIQGEWSADYNDTNYRFTIARFDVMWNGTAWQYNITDNVLEPYDRITLRDAGLFEAEPNELELNGANIPVYNTEDAWENLNCNCYHASSENIHHNFSFAFELETYGIEAYEVDGMHHTSFGGFHLRIGSSSNWNVGHLLYLQLMSEWGPTGVSTLQDCVDGAEVWKRGDVLVDLVNSKHVYEVGNVRMLNGTQQYTFMKVDGAVVSLAIRPLDTTLDEYSTRIGIYYVSADADRHIAIRNAWAEDVYDSDHQGGVTDGETMGNGTAGLYFDLPANDAVYEDGVWSTLYWATSGDNILLDGNKFYQHGRAAICKYTANHYYLRFSDWHYDELISEGSVITLKGTFRHKISDGTYSFFKMKPISFIRLANGWQIYELGCLQDATVSDLPSDSMILNIGRTNPANRAKTAVKEFDQKVVWDNDLGEEVDTLEYKRDYAGNVGIYFSNSDSATHGEFRLYTPGNGYKTESKGYAMTQFSFNYIFKDSGVVTETGRNHSLTSDGYYVAATGPKTNKFTIQALCHEGFGGNMYYDFDVELIADGRIHTCTLNLAYGDIYGFCFVLWNFDGEFFMSNVQCDYLDYDQALNELVYDKLKMYSYISGDTCSEYYPAAKAAYDALTTAEKTLFTTHAAYGSAFARLQAWANAVGETVTTNGIVKIPTSFTPNADNTNLIIILSVASIAAIAGATFFVRRRRSHK
ncbi:MAG: hypothetical protein IJ247_03635 [Bacilli bacterium]|nr:hypothetical protein [Bacilli bacterium]